ncbi:M14 family zinc carboxypeptidase [Roseimarinus sediminis]|uniref:M14 family zinc carboxypeptidase n=1 Tax=Roseimarinus sediminis TaxID=1610899 RepID=UPI003D200504
MQGPTHHLQKIIAFFFAVTMVINTSAQSESSQLTKRLSELTASDTRLSIETLTQTAGKRPMQLIKIGDFAPGEPAIFVAANLSGNLPLNTEGALWFARYLLESDKLDPRINWYLLPTANPDAYERFYAETKWDYPGNDTPVNNDNDHLINEDAPEDLNKDGIISSMLVPHPLGTLVRDSSDSRLLRTAAAEKGEKGLYRLYTEGIDNDNDGQYNEDPEGGVNINRNFTYGFESFVPENGKWNGSENESRALLKFFSEHPEIAMVVVLGETSNLMFPPDEKSISNGNEKLKVPSYYARRIGVDEKKMYTLDELSAEIAANMSDVAMGQRILKAVKNQKAPTQYEKEDAALHQYLSLEYKSWLKQQELPVKVMKTPEWGPGSFEKTAYFQYGLPVFSMNLNPLPLFDEKAPDKTDSLSIQKLKLQWADSLAYELFINWESHLHPQLGEVLIGGWKPYALQQIPADSSDLLFEKQLPFIVQLAQKLPVLNLNVETKEVGGKMIRINAYVSNSGKISFPTAMGERNEYPAPAILSLTGDFELLEGKTRTPVGKVDAGSSNEFIFLVRKKSSKAIELKLEGKNVLFEQASLKID